MRRREFIAGLGGVAGGGARCRDTAAHCSSHVASPARRLVANKVFDFSHDLHTRWIPFRVEGACSIHCGDKSRIGLHFRANRPVGRLSTKRSTIRGIRIVRLAHFTRNHFDIIAAGSSIGTRYAEAENKSGDRQVHAHQTPVPLPLDLGAAG